MTDMHVNCNLSLVCVTVLLDYIIPSLLLFKLFSIGATICSIYCFAQFYLIVYV